MQHKIAFPGYMERCCGFTIPDCGVFYAFYFEYNLARFDVLRNEAIELDEEWQFDEQQSILTVVGRNLPFIGLWGGEPLLSRSDLGSLSLHGSEVKLTTPDGEFKSWTFENFSGDWAAVTFDVNARAFLYGAPYDFDFRYVEIVPAAT